MLKKQNAALASIFSNTLLIIMKLVVGVFTGAISIISEAIHSMTDLIAAIVAFIAVRIADRPPDKNHPYGHEKVENISGVIEAILIFIAAAFIVFEAVKKIISHERVENLLLGVVVMFISGVVNMVVSSYLYKVAKKEDSIALEADALHLKVDVYTSFGVGAGLLLIFILKAVTKLEVFYYLDPAIAILVALFILKEAGEMFIKAYAPLIDSKISDSEIEAIETIIKNYPKEGIGYHDIRTRKAGKIKHVDFHLTTPKNFTIEQAHAICDELEKQIEFEIHNSRILIHIEPDEVK